MHLILMVYQTYQVLSQQKCMGFVPLKTSRYTKTYEERFLEDAISLFQWASLHTLSFLRRSVY